MLVPVFSQQQKISYQEMNPGYTQEIPKTSDQVLSGT
jgi:hypothetical protein